MHRTPTIAAILLLLFAKSSHAQLPSNFSWINLESDKKTMPIVRQALHNQHVTAIREVGVKDGFALVMTTSRQPDEPTPDYDSWEIYSINLSTEKSRELFGGYGVKLLEWIGSNNEELAVSYFDCWECEAATLLTTIHLVPGSGWQPRWPNKPNNPAGPPLPGAVVDIGDMGMPYDDNDVDQIYAFVKQPDNRFAIGTWTYSRNTITGKIEQDVERYSIDPKTGNDRTEKLSGQAALDWKRVICNRDNILTQASSGQDSKTCHRIMPKPTAKQLQNK
jgi:hypothetical protein